jgi:hypothetical protein
MAATIDNNRIGGTRITIYDVFHYLDNGWRSPDIAAVRILEVFFDIERYKGTGRLFVP